MKFSFYRIVKEFDSRTDWLDIWIDMVKEICMINIHGKVILLYFEYSMKNVSSANGIDASEILVATSRLSSCRCWVIESQF
jgi:hypothetical protein